MVDTHILSDVTYELKAFIAECKDLGFKNNDSLNAMNFYQTLNDGGTWFATYDDKRMVGISGLHKFRDGWRALYRGCQLYSIPGGLSKNHMNCWMFKYHLPIVIDLVGDDPIYITTNIENDASGYMKRLNKLYFYLAKKGIVDHIEEAEVFQVQQNVWKLNKEIYLKVRGEE